jgi:putative SOS response-associated peptidase YedK
MCCRYYYADRIARRVEEDMELPEGICAHNYGDITPGMMGLSLIKGSGAGVKAYNMKWGLTGKDSKLIINARAESAVQKPMFSDSIRSRRCVLPAGGFYEWNKDKTKYTFKRPDEEPMYLAGFYDLRDNEDRFVILTTDANDSMRPVHDRMPVMIDKKNVADYLYDEAAAYDLIKKKMPELDRNCDYEQLSLF